MRILLMVTILAVHLVGCTQWIERMDSKNYIRESITPKYICKLEDGSYGVMVLTEYTQAHKKTKKYCQLMVGIESQVSASAEDQMRWNPQSIPVIRNLHLDWENTRLVPGEFGSTSPVYFSETLTKYYPMGSPIPSMVNSSSSNVVFDKNLTITGGRERITGFGLAFVVATFPVRVLHGAYVIVFWPGSRQSKITRP